MEVHSLIPGWGLGVVHGLTCVNVDMWGKELDHVAQIYAHEESRHPEPEHGQSHGEVDDEWGCFIPDIEVFFVVNMVGSHFPEKSVEGALSA